MKSREPIDIIIIDGPNLFNTVAAKIDTDLSLPDRAVAIGGGEKTVASKIDTDPSLLKRYLKECFDMDLLALESLDPSPGLFGRTAYPRMGIVIFHSRKPLGRGAYRLDDCETGTFWARHGSNAYTSTFVIDIPGDQQDTFTFTCSECGTNNEATTRSEKGIDTSIATYLMETLESWQSMCLFTRDVDYVPLITALRRKGKIVYVAVPAEEKTTALVRVAQSTIPLNRFR